MRIIKQVEAARKQIRSRVLFTHVLRKLNAIADWLCNQAFDSKCDRDIKVFEV